MRKSGNHTLLVGHVKGDHFGKQFDTPDRVAYAHIIQPPRIYPRETLAYEPWELCAAMSTITLFLIAPNSKQTHNCEQQKE